MSSSTKLTSSFEHVLSGQCGMGRLTDFDLAGIVAPETNGQNLKILEVKFENNLIFLLPLRLN